MWAWLSGLLWMALAYVLGSISFAIIVSKLLALQDPRSYGSQNPGATNMLRSGRKEAALFTLIGDALKGFIPVYLAARWGELSLTALVWVAFAAFMGHLYPIFFHFKGGKGVATFLGAMLGLSSSVGLWVIVAWLLTAVVFRYASVASLMASVVAFVLFALHWGIGWALLPLSFMVFLMFYRLLSNLQKLKLGQEGKLFAPK